MTVAEILKRVDKISADNHYWFVRTDYGAWFEDFTKGNFIAIGWDYLTLYELKNSKEETIKGKIAKVEKIDNTKFQGKIKVTATYNKLKTFISLKKDDVIVIPSRNSDRLAFGRITDNEPYEDINAKEFIKRRKVEWYEIKNMDDLNPIFYQVKSNQHTISNIDWYAPHIDRVIGNLFKKGENTHYVLNIEREESINFDDLKTLMDDIKILSNNINNYFDFGENPDEFFIKINLQSKGALELIKEKGKTLAVLAYLMHLVSCNELDKERDEKIETFIKENKRTLNSTSKVIDTLKINTAELTKPFKNGN